MNLELFVVAILDNQTKQHHVDAHATRAEESPPCCKLSEIGNKQLLERITYADTR